MKKISRRKAMRYIGSSVVITGGLSSCCCVRDWLNVWPCDPREKWKDEAKDWWLDRQREREREREEAINNGTRPDLEIPFPFLICWREDGEHGSVASQFNNFTFNQWETFYVVISNDGNAASWNCIVESYETPWGAYNKPWSSFTLNDRIMVSLMPTESREVQLKFRVTRQNGGMRVRCYDPFADFGPLTYIQYDRHSNGFSWDSWQ